MNLDLHADRTQALTVPCPKPCSAAVGQPCTNYVTGEPLRHLAAHDARLKAAGVLHAPLDTRELRADPDRSPRR